MQIQEGLTEETLKKRHNWCKTYTKDASDEDKAKEPQEKKTLIKNILQMAKITASEVNALRKQTGAGMMIGKKL